MFNKGRGVFCAVTALIIGLCIFWGWRLRCSGGGLLAALNPVSDFSFDVSGMPVNGLAKTSSHKLSFSKSVAVLYIDGIIEDENKTYNQSWLCDTIDSLASSNQNHGIMLFISSPGGGVYQADELYTKLCEYKEKTNRPVWAYLGPMAASGGYYIACAADTIYANRNTLTGSIGVICGQSVDMTGLFDKIGIKVQTIHSGKNKTMLNPDTPMTQEQQAIMQAISDECYDQFVSIVSESRSLSAADVREKADGRIYTARQAEQCGLIDGIADFETAKKTMQEQCGISSSIPFEDMRYEYKMTFDSFFSTARAALSGVNAAVPGFVSRKIDSLSFYPSYYAPGFEQ